MLAMMPRIRWTADFQVDHVRQGNITNWSFRLIDARDSATPFCVTGFFFQTNRSYRVGFDRIAEGEVRGLEILTTDSNSKQPIQITPANAGIAPRLQLEQPWPSVAEF
jgi:hypothetical protein